MDSEYKLHLNEEEIENVKFALEKMSEYRDCPGFLFSDTMKNILLKIDVFKQLKKECEELKNDMSRTSSI